jgi:hypothetical protein
MSPIALLKAFVHALNDKMFTGPIAAEIFAPSAPVSVTTWTHDKNYKVKPIAADEEFTFKTAKLGARHQIIFEFEPLDPTKCIHIEIDETKAFGVFPDFEQSLIVALNVTHDRAVNFANSKVGWISAERDRLKGEIKTAVEVKAEIMQDAYGDNPNWGSF